MNKLTLTKSCPIEDFDRIAGGKAKNMARLSQKGIPVPNWFCVTAEAFDLFVQENDLEKRLVAPDNLAQFEKEVEKIFLGYDLPKEVEEDLKAQLSDHKLDHRFLAVRSSGIDEDSAGHSFAGQFSSYLYQKGFDAISKSIRLCWASGYSERALSYRKEKGISTEGIRVGVVVQLMVNSDVSGVAFSRNPVKPLDRDSVIVDAVWGQGEGLVSGLLDADHFEVSRKDLKIESQIVEKPKALTQSEKGGLEEIDIDEMKSKMPALTNEQVRDVAKLCIGLEEKFILPQDCEWAFENGELFCLQTRPITTLPPNAFYNKESNGEEPTLWDNSNIIESYSGVTSPLTFSFASYAYRQVYVQFCEIMGRS